MRKKHFYFWTYELTSFIVGINKPFRFIYRETTSSRFVLTWFHWKARINKLIRDEERYVNDAHMNATNFYSVVRYIGATFAKEHSRTVSAGIPRGCVRYSSLLRRLRPMTNRRERSADEKVNYISYFSSRLLINISNGQLVSRNWYTIDILIIFI